MSSYEDPSNTLIIQEDLSLVCLVIHVNPNKRQKFGSKETMRKMAAKRTAARWDVGMELYRCRVDRGETRPHS